MSAAYDHLFELIRALSQSEKRFFKLEASKYARLGNNDYMRLYDAIESQPVYDEDKIKAQLQDTPIGRRYASVKNYLYKLLIKTLTAYHSDRTVELQIHQLLQQVEVLFGKGLYRQSAKILQSAKKLAIKYHKVHQLLLIHQWEYQCASTQSNFRSIMDMFDEVLVQEHQTLLTTQRHNDYLNLHVRTFRHLFEHGLPRSAEEGEFYKTTLQHPLLQSEQTAITPQTKNWFYAIKSVCYHALGWQDKALESNLHRVDIFNQYPEYREVEAMEYVKTLHNVLQVLMTKNDLVRCKIYIKQAQAFYKDCADKLTQLASGMCYYTIHLFTIRIYAMQGEFDKIAAWCDIHGATYEEMLQAPERDKIIFTIPLQLASAYFILGNYETSLHWVRLVLNDNTHTVRRDVLGFTRILHLLIQYELNNTDILESYIQSTQRYLQEYGKKMTQFERIFLKLTRKLLSQPKWSSSYMKMFQRACDDLNRCMEQEGVEQTFVRQFHLNAWLESKLQKRPMLEIVLDNLHKESAK